MAAHDLDWVVDVTRLRRESLAPHAPRFWCPAHDATEQHRAFLSHCIEDPESLSVRCDNGYIMALDQGTFWLVDDAVVTPDGDWAVDGVRLLMHAQEHCGALRLVVPVFETDRMAAGQAMGLAPVEQWWHRDLEGPSRESAAAKHNLRVNVEGAEGRLVPAPPVYDPGGPVLLVNAVDSLNSLRRIEDAAWHRGARVAVVTQSPSDSPLATLLSDAGYVLTTAFCEV